MFRIEINITGHSVSTSIKEIYFSRLKSRISYQNKSSEVAKMPAFAAILSHLLTLFNLGHLGQWKLWVVLRTPSLYLSIAKCTELQIWQIYSTYYHEYF